MSRTRELAGSPAVCEAVKNGMVTEALMKPFEVDRLIKVIADAITR